MDGKPEKAAGLVPTPLSTFLTELKRRQVDQLAALPGDVIWSPYCTTRIVNFDARRRYSVAQAVKFE